MSTSPSPTLSGFGEIDDALAESLATRLGVQDEFDLAFAIATNRIRDVAELGPELQERLRLALRMTPWRTPRRALMHARGSAVRLLTRLQESETCLRLAATGPVRRMDPVVEGLELLATAHDPEALRVEFESLPFIEPGPRDGEEVATGRMPDGTHVRLRVFPEDPMRFFVRLLHDTGPEPFFRFLQSKASSRDLVLTPDDLTGNDSLVPAGECELLARLGLEDRPPERRSGDYLRGTNPDLVSMADIRGVAHLHTADGAGRFDIPTLAARALREGYSWALIADRSCSAFPRGISTERLAAQVEAVRTWRRGAQEGMQLFHAVEASVDEAGALDLSDEALGAVDGVIAVVEDAPGESQSSDPTPRYLAAIRHPRVRVLAHPRLPSIGGPARAPDWTYLLPALVTADVAIEVSGASHRLPYPQAWHRQARDLRVRALPAADAHDLEDFDQAIAAVAALRRGGWSVSEVAATLDTTAFGRLLEGIHQAGGA